jgi:hypothetical protein
MLGAGMAQLGSIYNRNAAENYPDSARNRGRIATGRRRRMSQLKADFLIIGSSPLARLLAGLLASHHGRTVLLQARDLAGRRLRPGVDLSVGAITRPESWALLAAAVPETTRLVRRIGKRAALTRLDPILFADRASGQAELGHIRHMAAGFGLAAERLPPHSLGPDREGLVLRDAVLLNRPVLEPALDRWLAQLGVRRLDPDLGIAVADDGRAVVTLDDASIEIGQTLLADDAAILAHLPDIAWPALLQRQDASLVLTRPVPPIAAPVMVALDTGIVLQQQAEGGVLAQGAGGMVGLAGQLGVLLGLPYAFEQAGQASFVRLGTRDGAPALGRVGGTGPDILAGFGPIGAFLAPALARWLCGVASPAENAWCAARLVNRDGSMAPVSDIGAMP